MQITSYFLLAKSILESKGMGEIFQNKGKEMLEKGKIFKNLGKNVQNLKIFWKRAGENEMKMKHEIHFTEELENETHSGNKICPVYVLQRKTFYKKYMKKVAPIYFLGILCKNESE